MFSALRRLVTPSAPTAADTTYIALVDQARNAFFYTALGVPDTLDGRFEMILLHLFLLQHRLHAEDTEFARHLSEIFLADMDRSLRELGVGDTGVAHRIRKMGRAYHGRLQAYSAGLDDADALRSALARNLYGTVAQGDVALLAGMEAYIRRMATLLAETPTAAIISGNFIWPVVTD